MGHSLRDRNIDIVEFDCEPKTSQAESIAQGAQQEKK